MQPYVAAEKKHAKSEHRKFSLKKAIHAAKKTYKKSSHHSSSKHKTHRRKGFFDGGGDIESEEETPKNPEDVLAPGRGISAADEALAEEGGRRRKHRKHGRK